MWRKMLADGPMVRSKIIVIGKIWLATHWNAANDVMRDQDRFVRDGRRAGKKTTFGIPWLNLLPRYFKNMAKNMLAYDKEDHRRLRSLVDIAFRKRQIETLRPRIQQLTQELLDRVESIARANNGVVDFRSHFSKDLPLAVICEVLGLPTKDRPMFKNLFRGFTELKSAFSIVKVLPAIKRLSRYLEEQFEIVRKNPRPGLMTELVNAEESGHRLSRDELLSTVMLLLLAGHETTVHLINTGLYCLLTHPEQKEKLTSNWDHSLTAVNEILRWGSVAQLAKPRHVASDFEFHGVPLKQGDLVMPVIGAANFDPEKFRDPESFDITRSPNPHMSFGTGVHFCVGMNLARAEAEIAFQEIFTRFPQLRFENSPEDIVWAKRMGMRSAKKMPLQLEV